MDDSIEFLKKRYDLMVDMIKRLELPLTEARRAKLCGYGQAIADLEDRHLTSAAPDKAEDAILRCNDECMCWSAVKHYPAGGWCSRLHQCVLKDNECHFQGGLR